MLANPIHYLYVPTFGTKTLHTNLPVRGSWFHVCSRCGNAGPSRWEGPLEAAHGDAAYGSSANAGTFVKIYPYEQKANLYCYSCSEWREPVDFPTSWCWMPLPATVTVPDATE